MPIKHEVKFFAKKLCIMSQALIFWLYIFAALCAADIGIRKFEFVGKTKFL